MQLTDLDPESVAREGVERIVEHFYAIASRLDPTLVLALPTDVGAAGLRPTLHALTAYAQRGLPVWDWTDSGMAADGLLDALAALYGSPCGGLEATAIDVVDDVDPEDAIGLVLVGAAARIRLDQGRSVTARELAVLAGVAATYVRRLARKGELMTTDERPARIAAEDAMRWLNSRSIAFPCPGGCGERLVAPYTRSSPLECVGCGYRE